MNLRECDGKDVAVMMAIGGENRLLQGRATYVSDTTLGNCLSIHLDDPNSPGTALLLKEDDWTGRIQADETQRYFAIIYLNQECSRS